MLKIYGRPNSINVRKVLWTADEIAVPFTREDWGRGFKATDAPEFRRLNPFGLVPVIDDGGMVLRESNTICRYLAMKHGRADLLPTDLAGRFMVEQWMDWGSTELYTPMRPIFMGAHLKFPDFSDPKLIERSIADEGKQLTVLATHLEQGGPYVMGKAFTLADVPAGLVVHRWFTVDIKRPEIKAITAYYERLKERPAFRAHGANGMP